jgi:RNA polymerase sigma factor (sigma-70 family)
MSTIDGKVMRVTYPAREGLPSVPAALAALLDASLESARDQAWAEFVRVVTDTILRVARSLGGDSDRVMDRYAFVLDRLREDDCRRLRAYLRPDAGDFTLWLIVVTRRLCLDEYRERYGRPRRGDGLDDSARAGRRRLVDLVADRTDPSLLAAPQHDPHEQLVQADRMRALTAAVSALAPADRLLLRLRFAEQLPAREIAKLLHLPTLFHVYRRVDAVLRELRRALAVHGLEGAP